MSLKGRAAIVAAHEHGTRYAPDKTPLQLQAECAKAALAEAGLTKDDVDGLLTAGAGTMPLLTLAEYLNIRPRFLDSTSVGGSSFVFHVGHAAAAIAAGLCQVALITYGSNSRSQHIPIGTGGFGGAVATPIPDSFEVPYGLTTIGAYALVAQRHMHQYGTTSAQLAEIAVATRRHASLNPHALFQEPITIDDVLNSRLISSPLHLYDCCVISDGGGAVVVTSPERARDLRKPPVFVLGYGEACAHTGLGWEDLTFVAAKQSGAAAFHMAGVTHKDIDMAMIYDSFTITVLTTLEDLGFCPKGEGGRFVEGGRIALGGALPINTDGGGLSSNHPGMRGIFLLIEAARQLWGEAGPRQVAGTHIALCHGTGGRLGTRHSGATLILGREQGG